MAFGDSFSECNSFRAGGHRVRGILDVCTGDILPREGEQDRSDVKVTVWTVGGLFGLNGFLPQGVEFVGREVVCSA